MANAKYLKVSSVGTEVATAISNFTGNANEMVNTNASGKLDDTLIDFPVNNSNFLTGTVDGLNIEILEGSFSVNNNTIVDVVSDVLTLTDDSINYIGVTTAGVFIVNTTGFTNFVYALYEVTTLSGAITVITDLRSQTNLVNITTHTQNTDYKLDDYTQTIDITGLTDIDFLTGTEAITSGKNKIILTSSNTEEIFTITDFPSYEITLHPSSGLILNILPSSTLYTESNLVRIIDGNYYEFIKFKKNTIVQEIQEELHQYVKLEEITSTYNIKYNSNARGIRCEFVNGFWFIIDTNDAFEYARIRKFNSDWTNEELVYTHSELTRYIASIDYYGGYYYIGLWSNSVANQIIKFTYNTGTNVFDTVSTYNITGQMDYLRIINNKYFQMDYLANRLIMYDSETDGSFKNTILKQFTDADGMQFGTNYIYHTAKIYYNTETNELLIQTISSDRTIYGLNIYNLDNVLNIAGNYFKSRHTSDTDYVYNYGSGMDLFEGGYISVSRESLATISVLNNINIYDYNINLLCKIPVNYTSAYRCLIQNNYFVIFDISLGSGNFNNQSVRIFKIL